jgi:hypothetical protein
MVKIWLYNDDDDAVGVDCGEAWMTSGKPRWCVRDRKTIWLGKVMSNR